MSAAASPGSLRDLGVALRRAGELLGGGRRLDVAETFRDSPNVFRCAVSGADPPTVILKLADADPPPAGWLEEWVAGEWLSSLGEPGLAPRCYGADPRHGVLLLEDVGGAQSLLDVLMEGDGESSARLLIELARRLGALHRATAGRGAELAELRRRRGLPDRAAAEQQAGELRRLEASLGPVLGRLGLAAPDRLGEELAALAATVERPGPFLAYTHGDPCPDNCRVDGGELRLIDFEDGALRHAWTEGVVARMLFPTCWCVRTVPEPVLAEMDTAYAEAWAEVPAGDRERARLDACALWLLATLDEHLGGALERDEVWGIATLRQRILARLEAFRAVAAESGRFDALRRLTERLSDVLSRRWPDTATLEPFPAFAGDRRGGEDLALYTGEYSGELGTLRIDLAHGQLFLYSRLLGENLPCVPTAPETFAFKYGLLRFLRAPDGTLGGLEVEALGTTLPMQASNPPRGESR